MHRSLSVTASVLALALFALPALAQPLASSYPDAAYSAATVDPYGYGNVPLPPPQPVLMPSYLAQQAANGSPASSAYAGQATPQPVTTAQFGIVPDYLPERRATRVVQPVVQQASSVGYSVQPQASNPPVTGSYASAPYASAAAQPYAPQQQAPALSAPINAPLNSPANAYASNAYTANPYAVPQSLAQSPSPQATPQGGQPSAYGTANASVQNSITTATTYDNAATSAPAYQPLSIIQQAPSSQQAYAPQAYTAPGYAVQNDAWQMQQPQAQPYAPEAQSQGAAQPQTYMTTQIYTPSPALTVQQTTDVPDYQTASYPPPQQVAQDDRVSLATDPSVGPWYFTLRSGLTLAQDTQFQSAGADVIHEYQPGWQLGTGVGYEFKAFNNWLAPRAELEMTYDQQLVDTQTTGGVKSTDPNAYGFQRSLDVLANGYLDVRLNRFLSPYVGAGIGFGYSDFDRYGTSAGGVIMDENDVGFVWQAMGGLGINLSSSTMVDFGYRYQQNTGVTLKAEDGTTSTPDEGKHIIMVGFRNNF